MARKWSKIIGITGGCPARLDIISGPLYFRTAWGASLDDWKNRAKVWRQALEHHWPEYATKPKFLWIAHREGGSGEEKPWLHELQLSGDPGPDWFVEFTRYCVQDLGINVVGYGIETDSRHYGMAFYDYVVPAHQAVSAAQPNRPHPKPIVDPPILNTGLYAGAMAIYWATNPEGREIADLSGNNRTLRRFDYAPLDVHGGAYVSPELGMNGAALRFERHDPTDDDPPRGDFVADGLHANEAALPNTILSESDPSAFTLSLIYACEQPVKTPNEGIVGWSKQAGSEPSVSVYVNPPVNEPYTPPKIYFEIRFISGETPQAVILETEVLDYGEPAQYVLTVNESAGSKLYRQRAGESAGTVVDSDATSVDFGAQGSTTSYFSIGKLPPTSAVTSGVVEQCVIWNRVLSSTELQQIADDPYRIPGQ